MAGVTSLARARTRVRLGRVLVVFVAVLVLEVLVAAVWGGWQVLQARDDLMAGREQAGAGQAALAELDLEAAASAFGSSSASFESGRDRLLSPVLRIAGVLPVVGDDVEAVRALALAGHLVADGAQGVLVAVLDAGGLDAFKPTGGRLPVDAVASLADPAQAARSNIEQAAALASDVPDAGVDRRILDARDELVAQVDEAEGLVATASQVTSALPALLGADGPRRYLFAAENPAEQRGTGGFLGAYSVLEIDDGRLSFGEFIRIQDLTSLPWNEIAPPNADYAARYNRFGGAGFWQAVNATPDFPSAATAIERLWEATEGTPVDGVIAVDPLAFEALLEISGPVSVPEFGEVGADEVVDVVANEAYDEFEQEERKQILGGIAARALQGTLAGDVDPLEAGEALMEVAAGGHLKMHVEDPDGQALLAELGLDGALLDPDGDFLAVATNSASWTKLDFYIERTVEYEVRLREDGSAHGTATVTFANDAPTQGPRHVIGPGWSGRLAAGEQRSWVSVYCAVDCEPSGTGDATAERELGHGVVSDFVRVRSGETASMTVEWELADAWDPSAGSYRLTYQAQPTLRPTTLRLDVVAPDGWQVTGDDGFDGTVEGTVEFQAALERT